jgi:hypothetical protein
MFKNLLLGIGLFGLAIASAKTYTITLSEPYTVGTTQLKAGDYKLLVNGSTATLEDQQGKVQVNGTLVNEAQKFNDTAVVSDQGSGAARLKKIEVGGTRF